VEVGWSYKYAVVCSVVFYKMYGILDISKLETRSLLQVKTL
jgi:hypothetical protein